MRQLSTPVLLLLLLTAACSARHLREAQDRFSDAAATENRAYEPANPGALLFQGAAASGYRVALDLVTREIDENEAALRADDLLGTALVLKALCHWRLAALDIDATAAAADGLAGTLTRIEQERRAKTIRLGERDVAMVAALPGLRDLDRGRRAEEYADAARFFGSAVVSIDRALEPSVTPPRHPVRIYLRLAQLAALREWHAAIYALLSTNEERDPERLAVKRNAVRVMAELNAGWPRDVKVRKAVEGYAAAMGIARQTTPGFTWNHDG